MRAFRPNFRAVERLCAKLEGVRGTGEAVEMGEMFRHLTLQVGDGGPGRLHGVMVW